jgi:nickel-dependent lactate racemase
MTEAQTVRLPYGTGTVEVRLPAGDFLTLSLPPESGPGLGHEAVKATLTNPIGSPPLAGLAGPETDVVVSVPDATRRAGAQVYLPALVELLGELDVPDENITFLFATGLHRPVGEMEKIRIVGPDLFERIACLNHNPVDEDNLVALGETSRGTPVSIHRRACDAGLVIATGAVSFHFHAGFGGGPKAVVPGLAGEETIRRNHLLSLEGEAGWHPGCRPGRTEGNPIHEDLLEAVGLLDTPVFLANSLVDSSGAIFDFVAGGMAAAHAIARDRYRSRFGRALDGPVDAAVVSAGGRPGDTNLIQSHKAIAHAAGVVRDGGTIVLAAECVEGLGHPDFEHWLDFRTAEDIYRETRTCRKKYPQTAFALREKASRFDILYVTAMEADLVARLDGRKVTGDEVGPFLAEKHGESLRGVVIPQGAKLLPYL